MNDQRAFMIDVQNTNQDRRPDRKRVRVIALLVLVVALLLAWLAIRYLGRGPQSGPAATDPTVEVAQPLQKDAVEWDAYIGRFEASRTVQVRPRVSGQLIGVHFRDGTIVQPGQLLFTIDPRPYETALAQARAELASARSDLELARINAERAARLRPSDAIAQSEADNRNARVGATAAAVEAAEAVVRARELDVEFTEVRAPIGGLISDRRVDAGNQVTAATGNAGTLLTTINALDPIYFSFNSSEALYLKTKRARDTGAQPSPVEIRLQDEAAYQWRGALDFTDNGLDPRSGTIRGRVTVANPDLFLTPGMFGDMRLAIADTRRALLVPDTAVSSDLTRKIVLVVGPNNVVAARTVELGALVDGLRITRAGLKPDDRIVVSGVQLVQPGQRVQVRPGSITPQPQATGEAIATPQARTATMGEP
ncbi:efflux RND transporter periplasmic adaptor subunit [Bradyrhizobium sp. USDA 10063]